MELRGRELQLPERSFRLLEILIGAAGTTVSKDRLVEEVWQGACVSDTSITEAMSRLREVLGDEARSPRYVRTIHGRGYKFIAPLELGGRRGPHRRPRWLPLSIAASIALVGAVWIGTLTRVSTSTAAAGDTDRPRFRLAEYAVNGEKVEEYDVPALPFNDFSVSQAGDRVAFSIDVGTQTGAWVLEPRKGELRRVTHGGSFTDPVWTPDGRSLAMSYRHRGSFDLVLQEVDRRRPAQILLAAPLDQYPEAWLHEGRALIYSERHPETGYDLWMLRQSIDGKWLPTPLLRTPNDEAFAAISPDDRYLAFASKNDRQPEIFVLDLRSDQPPVRVSHSGGAFPFWSRTGDRLHYVKGNEVLTVASDQIGREVAHVRLSSTAVPGLRLAASASAVNRIIVVTLD